MSMPKSAKGRQRNRPNHVDAVLNIGYKLGIAAGQGNVIDRQGHGHVSAPRVCGINLVPGCRQDSSAGNSATVLTKT